MKAIVLLLAVFCLECFAQQLITADHSGIDIDTNELYIHLCPGRIVNGITNEVVQSLELVEGALIINEVTELKNTSLLFSNVSTVAALNVELYFDGAAYFIYDIPMECYFTGKRTGLQQ